MNREKRVAQGFIGTIVCGPAKYLWHMPFTGCGGAITVIYDETSHHGISFSKWYTAIHRWIPTCAIFLSNRGHVTAERAQGLLLITDTYFDGWIHVKQSNVLKDTYTWRGCPCIFTSMKAHLIISTGHLSYSTLRAKNRAVSVFLYRRKKKDIRCTLVLKW